MQLQRPKPVTEQIRSILRQRIHREEYPPGSQFPSESDLMEEFGVSRTTIRVATTALVAEQLIKRKQGDGTYVRKKTLEHKVIVSGFESFQSMIEASGYKAMIHGASIDVRPASVEEAYSFEIEPDDSVIIFNQLHLADDQPAIFSKYIMPAQHFVEDINKCNVGLPIQDFLRIYCQQEIAYMKTDIYAVLSAPEVMEAFNLKTPIPFFKFVDLFFNDEDLPLVLSTVWFDNRILDFSLIRTWNN